jgi:pyruvate dehydrogenase E1 component beta subunit
LREIKFWQAFRETLFEEMRRDPTIVYFGEDAGPNVGGPFALSKGLYEEFGPNRVFETPDSEGAYVGVAIGLAATGYRPIVDIMAIDFTAVAMDQIVNTAAKIRYMSGGQIKRLPLVIHTLSGAGNRGGAQHSQSLEAWFVNIPGLKMVAPSNPYDLKGIMKSAIRDDNPVIVMKHKAMLGMKGEVPEDDYSIPLGCAVVKREGKDVTVVAVSNMVNVSLKAASTLQKEGIDVEVIDPLTLSPLDEETIIASVKKTGRLVTVHEAWKPCGMGAEIASVVFEKCFDFLQAPLERVTASFNPMPYNPGMEDYSLPDAGRIAQAVRRVMET